MSGASSQFRGANAPLTTEQEAMWLADVRNQLEGNALLEKLVIIENLWVDEPVSAARLTRSVSAVVQHNEDLRFATEVLDGEVIRRVLPPYIPELCRIELDPNSAPAHLDTVTEQMHRELIGNIAMAAGRLLAVGLLDVGPRCSIFFAAHHISCDDQSMQHLKKTVLNLYAGTGSPQELTTQVLQPRRITGIDAPEVRRWRGKSAQLRPMINALDGNDHADYDDTSVANHALDSALALDVKHLAAATRTTVFMVMLAMYQLFIPEVLHTEFPVVLSMRSTRQRTDKHSPGLWVEPIIFAWNMSSQCTFRDLLRFSRQEVLGALRTSASFVSLAKDVPAIADLMTDDEHLSLMFQHIGARPELSLGATTVEHDTGHSGLRAVPVDMAWWLHDVSDGLHIRSLSRDRVIAPDKAADLLVDFEQHVRSVIERGIDTQICCCTV